jgi:Ca2+-binding RTX toxin-like protein
MNKFAKRSIMLTLMGFAILAIGSSLQLMQGLNVPNVNAQQFPIASPSNSSNLSPLSNLSVTNQTGESLVESFGSPQSLMEAVIREAENTNATDFAARQLIQTTTSNMSCNLSNATGLTGSDNMTGDATNDTAMKAVIEQTVNTNATGFAADNVINMTSPQSTGPGVYS